MPRLHGAPDPAPLRIRVVPRDEVGLTAKGFALLDPAREHVARDVAADIVALLRSGAEIDGEGRIRPGHIAVLVRTNRTAARVRDALEAVDVPAVINGAGSVFGTEPALEWLRLLEAIERPSYPPRARSAALTTFLGWTTEEVAAADDDAWEAVHSRLHHWARVLRAKGVASLMEAITLEEGLPARVLAMVDGERRMTDLRHVGELLHAAAMTEQMGATALTAWLRERVLEATTDNNDEERSRRLESDAEAVQVLTMHRSKGLEFPVVYYPDLWEPSPTPREKEPVTFHDAAGRRTIDVGLEGPQWKGHRQQHIDEQRGEDLRLAYVALTRAKHQAVVWWAGSWASRDSALSRLLFARDDEGNVESSGASVPTDTAARARFRRAGGRRPGARERGCRRIPGRSSPGPATRPRPRPCRRRRSTARSTGGGGVRRSATSPPGPTSRTWRASRRSRSSTTSPGRKPRRSPTMGATRCARCRRCWRRCRSGPRSGRSCTASSRRWTSRRRTSTAELLAEIAAAQARRRVELGDVDAVVTGLRAAIETPLGPIAGGVALRDIARADRLDELDFELPLVGGDDPSGPALTLAAIADVLREHAAATPLAGYAERLLDPRLRASVRGYLTGSIDLVVRLGGERFAVVDYKTNWLAPPGEELTAWHHRPAALSAEMTHSHYGLQALLYTVALHRYLRWRLPGYSAERNLAGVLYLFVRGMTGPDTPVVDGIAVRRVHVAAVARAGRSAERRPRSRGGRMTDVVERFDARLARGASGLLLEFNDAGVLAAADVHVARRLAELVGGTDDSVLLAAALAVRAPRIGHVFVDLERIHETATVDVDDPIDLTTLPWPDRHRRGSPPSRRAASPAPTARSSSKAAPSTSTATGERSSRSPPTSRHSPVPTPSVDLDLLADGLTRLFTGEAPDVRQKQAAAAAVLRRLAVVAGGPGTGKTTTVARIVALLEEQALAAGAAPPLVALAAPTGKAAARLAEAVHGEAARLDVDPAIRARLLELEASTLHRLLGWKPGTHSRFRHDRGNRLPFDVVIVDETSMVSLSLMARLTEAVRREARLILVGDPGQLTSIEAGAVLGDIVGPAAEHPRMSAAVRAAVEEATGSTVEGSAPAADVPVGDGTVVLAHGPPLRRRHRAPRRCHPRRRRRRGHRRTRRREHHVDQHRRRRSRLTRPPGAGPRRRGRAPASPSSKPPSPAMPRERSASSAPSACCAPTAAAPTASPPGCRASRPGWAASCPASTPSRGTSAARCS